jgi:cytoskeletal protein CcmA (bactofilin family)
VHISREQTPPGTPSPASKEPTLSSVSMAATHEPTPSTTSPASRPAADRVTIGKSLQIKGEVIGSESLYIDGNVEGAINSPESRVTISREAQVSANITAREVVVFGKVRGNIYASDRVDIRSEGSLTGDVTAQRISIGEGAFCKGGIDISKQGQGRDRMVVAAISSDHSQTTPISAQAVLVCTPVKQMSIRCSTANPNPPARPVPIEAPSRRKPAVATVTWALS